MSVVSFKVFKTTKDLEGWQIKNNPKIISISPIVNGIGADVKERVVSAEAQLGCFVQYLKEVKDA